MLMFWSWFLFGYDYGDGGIHESFMHDILLPLHEAGHVLFTPFGQFMVVLGGSTISWVLIALAFDEALIIDQI
jgi:hypothetical protein